MEATVVTNTNVTFDNSHLSPFGDYSLTVLQNEAGDYTTMWFDKTELPSGIASSLTPITWNVDEEADYYLAPQGSGFSAASIAAGQFTPFFVVDNPSTIQVPYDNFYLGINTGVGFTGPPFHPRRDVFGWVHLLNTPNGLEMLGNAMAYGTQGIYIGTVNTVPEPESGSLLCLAMILLGLITLFSRRRHNVYLDRKIR